MTLPDKIKALPLPEPLWPERGRERAYRDAFSASQMRALLDAAATLAAEHEPDMGHPKIQALIGKAARRDIELGIAEDLLNDPAHEISGMDGDYWLPIHDKIVALQQAAAEHEARAQALADALEDMNAGWKYIRSFHGDLYGVGWDRAQDKADAALRAWKESQ